MYALVSLSHDRQPLQMSTSIKKIQTFPGEYAPEPPSFMHAKACNPTYNAKKRTVTS